MLGEEHVANPVALKIPVDGQGPQVRVRLLDADRLVLAPMAE